jgi:hypothetical protein
MVIHCRAVKNSLRGTVLHSVFRKISHIDRTYLSAEFLRIEKIVPVRV